MNWGCEGMEVFDTGAFAFDLVFSHKGPTEQQ